MVIDGLEGAYVNVNGIRMFYMQGGGNRSKPLVLVHGLFETGMMWRRVAQRLMQDFYLIIPDNRGYGMSEKPATMNQLTKTLQAQDLRNFCCCSAYKNAS